ncbi:unnamed protein product [Notodromas monacha]|uniref:Epsilon-sarcoglycan n=1 Tax=Notodromas monacha TaxID=399045 RepID=A0A7R9BG07_9CRUS|nr:unnamed protein product [Notodromas monacha]CAG0914597.1 unnamed protein product [Notodromas monacha]
MGVSRSTEIVQFQVDGKPVSVRIAMAVLFANLRTSAKWFTFCLLIAVSRGQSSEENTDTIVINATEVFVQRLTEIFDIPRGVNKHSFYASVMGYPDLHNWIHYAYDERKGEGYMYGMTPLPGQTKLHLSSLELATYNCRVMEVTLISVAKPGHARRQVEIELYNMDVQDMLIGNRMESLKNVLRNNLWRSADDLYYTLLEPAKRPNRMPREKEGVRVRLGSRARFSNDLKVLQMEVQPLYERRPCPINFKKTTAERFFRGENFGVDWCGFRLINAEPGKAAITFSPTTASHSGDVWETFKGQHDSSIAVTPTPSYIGHPYVRRECVPQRDYLWDALFAVVIPLISMVSLLILLTIIMSASRKNEDLEMKYKETQGLLNPPLIRDSVSPVNEMGSNFPDGLVRSRSESPESTQPKIIPSPRLSAERVIIGPDGKAPPPYHSKEINGKAIQGYHV